METVYPSPPVWTEPCSNCWICHCWGLKLLLGPSGNHRGNRLVRVERWYTLLIPQIQILPQTDALSIWGGSLSYSRVPLSPALYMLSFHFHIFIILQRSRLFCGLKKSRILPDLGSWTSAMEPSGTLHPQLWPCCYLLRHFNYIYYITTLWRHCYEDI